VTLYTTPNGTRANLLNYPCPADYPYLLEYAHSATFNCYAQPTTTSPNCNYGGPEPAPAGKARLILSLMDTF
jgi:hypothetical protein